MREKIWRKNKPELAVLDTPEVKDLSEKDFVKLLQSDVNSQLMWITANSCNKIACTDCYIKEKCTERSPGKSQALAASIIKGAISGN